LIRVLSISGSPTVNSSTEIILKTVAGAISEHVRYQRVQKSLVRLNELDFVPCQACGESPEPEFCFFDDLKDVYKKLLQADCVLFGSPVYFDSVSAQAKAFIDRCCCFRPADFDSVSPNPQHLFTKRLKRKRPGAIVLVGGQRGWFEGARRVVAGFFKWVELVNEGVITCGSPDFNRAGQVIDDSGTLDEARKLGVRLAKLLESKYAKK